MEDTISIIDKLIAEHKQIKESIDRCVYTMDDLCAARGLEDAKESFTPGRLEDLGQRATQLEDALELIVSTLEQHFYREEKGLLEAFERHGLAKLASLLHTLLSEHETIRTQLADMRAHAAKLTTVQTSRNVWEPNAWALRARIAHVGRELEAHALREEALFENAKKVLQGESG
jgi:hypothetical protein